MLGDKAPRYIQRKGDKRMTRDPKGTTHWLPNIENKLEKKFWIYLMIKGYIIIPEYENSAAMARRPESVYPYGWDPILSQV